MDKNLNAPTGRYFHRNLGIFRKLVLRLSSVSLVVVGLAIAYLAARFDLEHDAAVGGILVALADGFVVAGILALLVDYRVKKRLATEIAEATSEGLFRRFLAGDRAPSEYIIGLTRLSHAERLGFETTWTLMFSWVDSDTIEVRGRCESTTKNISGHDLTAGHIWLQNSVKDRSSTFVHYRSAIILDCEEGKAAQVNRLTLDQTPLMATARSYGDGIRVDLAHDFGAPCTPDGAIQTVDWEGVSFQSDVGYLPLSQRWPCLQKSVVLTGEAIHDLSFHVSGASCVDLIEPIVDDEMGTMTYVANTLTLAGDLMLVSWRPRSLSETNDPETMTSANAKGTDRRSPTPLPRLGSQEDVPRLRSNTSCD